METPKNTTQIGEIHGDYKVFIEDYVISYLKQLCRQEPDRKKRIAFYGVLRREETQQYFFIYGASEVKRYGRNDTYLTEQDYEEITWAGSSNFEKYIPLGFVTLEEELPEGIYIFCGGKERYVQGYHIFYEKNDSMLAFMVHRQAVREEEERLQEEPEEVTEPSLAEQPVRTERSIRTERPGGSEQEEIKFSGIIKSAAAALFIVLCVTAVSTMNGIDKIESVQNFFAKAFQTMTEQQLPDKEDSVAASAEGVEDLTEKLEQENREAVQEAEPAIVPQPEESLAVEETVPVQTEEAPAVEEPLPVQAEPQTHTIQKGETLISISKMYYGDESHVKAICELNRIADSDNIQIGQKIILP